MPARKQYGRAAVYRQLWSPLFRSPARAGLTLGMAIALIVAVRFLTGGTDADSAPVIPDPRPQGAGMDGPPVAAAPVTPSPPTPDPSGTSESQVVQQAATEFMSRWVVAEEKISAEEWVSRLRPYTHESYIDELKSVDPDNINATLITRPPRVVSLRESLATIDVATDAYIVRLEMIQMPDGWRVLSYSRAG